MSGMRRRLVWTRCHRTPMDVRSQMSVCLRTTQPKGLLLLSTVELTLVSQHPLAHTLIIHPGSRNLRLGRACDFYPHEIPNCIARPMKAPHRGRDPPVPGSRVEKIAQDELETRAAKRRKTDGEDHAEVAETDETAWTDPVSPGRASAASALLMMC